MSRRSLLTEHEGKDTVVEKRDGSFLVMHSKKGAHVEDRDGLYDMADALDEFLESDSSSLVEKPGAWVAPSGNNGLRIGLRGVSKLQMLRSDGENLAVVLDRFLASLEERDDRGLASA